MLSHYLRKSAKPPWAYPFTAVIPHYHSVQALTACLACLWRQSESPYVIVLDVGSPPECRPHLEHLRSDRVEIHYLCPHQSRHPYWYIAAALDSGLALSHTERVYLTHCDVFHKDRTWLETLKKQCDARMPVVGYEISPRDHWGDEWHGMVGHTSTMLYLPVIRRIGALFALDWTVSKHVGGWSKRGAFIDTEVGFNRLLRGSYIIPHLVGHDDNEPYYEDSRFVHLRSMTTRLHGREGQRDEQWQATYRRVITAALEGTL